jgi:hypothetical protein
VATLSESKKIKKTMDEEIEIDFENFPDGMTYSQFYTWIVENREDIYFLYNTDEIFEAYNLIDNRNTKINNILND